MRNIFGWIVWFNIFKIYLKNMPSIDISRVTGYYSIHKYRDFIKSRVQRLFFYNLSIGIIFYFVSIPFQNSVWFDDINNLFMDNMMKIMTTFEKDQKEKFLYLDIDEKSYQSWGEPWHTPRDKLLKLIQYSVAGGAKVIAVDIDLSWKGTRPENDELLSNYLNSYNSKALPAIFLVRSLHVPNKKTKKRVFRKNIFFDKSVGDQVYWASSQLELSEQDNTLRFWNADAIAYDDGRKTSIPSFSLMINSYLDGYLERDGSINNTYYLNNEIDLKNKEKGIEDRIIYTVPWKNNRNIEIIKTSDIPITLFEKCYTLSKDCDYSDIKGRIVIIAASHHSSNDLYKTPLGKIPGGMVVINTISSLKEYKQLKRSPLFFEVLVNIIVLIFISFAYSKSTSLLNTLIAGVILTIFLMPTTYFLFIHGLWLSLALPLISIQLFSSVSGYIGRLDQHNKDNNQ